MKYDDTIAAIATAPGSGGIAIIRMSGPESEKIMNNVFRPAGSHAHHKPLRSHQMVYGHIIDADEMIDECMAVMFRAPRSYTCEDVCELQLHGGSLNVQRVLSICLRAGARLADPGEFTRRAFMNGRIDLSQSEAVMGIISASGEEARAASMRQLNGGPSAFIRKAQEELISIMAGVSACIDYPEEISEEEAIADLLPRVAHLSEELRAACDANAVRILRSGLQVALCGRPNVGKSSLLNALLQEDRAIVTNIPGTTRDTITGTIQLNGVAVHLTDTAGLHATDDPVEKIGVARSEKALAEADVILAVIDRSAPLIPDDLDLLRQVDPARTILILNKSDLPAQTEAAALTELLPNAPLLSLSAAANVGLADLKAMLRDRAVVSNKLPLTQPRHLDAASRAAGHLDDAAGTLMAGLPVDLVQVDLDAAVSALGEITGDRVDEQLLDQIFNSFCVGK